MEDAILTLSSGAPETGLYASESYGVMIWEAAQSASNNTKSTSDGWKISAGGPTERWTLQSNFGPILTGILMECVEVENWELSSSRTMSRKPKTLYPTSMTKKFQCLRRIRIMEEVMMGIIEELEVLHHQEHHREEGLPMMKIDLINTNPKDPTIRKEIGIGIIGVHTNIEITQRIIEIRIKPRVRHPMPNRTKDKLPIQIDLTRTSIKLKVLVEDHQVGIYQDGLRTNNIRPGNR